jgi:hypothetical protein
VTWDGQQPHVVANWGDYIRSLSEPGSNTLVMPAGRYQRTEANLSRDKRVELILASRQVPGSRSLGQGYLLRGEGEIQLSGPLAEQAKSRYTWARGAFVIHVQEAQAQL